MKTFSHFTVAVYNWKSEPLYDKRLSDTENMIQLAQQVAGLDRTIRTMNEATSTTSICSEHQVNNPSCPRCNVVYKLCRVEDPDCEACQ